MKRFHIIHFGIGNVGRTLIDQLFANEQKIKRDFGIDLVYAGMFGSKGGFCKASGFKKSEVLKNITSLASPKITHPLAFLQELPSSFWKNAIIVDTTTTDAMFPVLSFALQKGASVVLSNKRPLAGKLSEFKKLQKAGDRFKFETTVGAGLPVIKVLKEFLATGDEVVEISGCVSGTLGFLCSELENGKSFSKSVTEAKEKGFTEFDPREDLSGMDVARKAIILARMIGNEIELSDLSVEALFPASYKKYSVPEFMEHVHELDAKYEKMFKDAEKKNMTFRYVATVSAKKVSVGLKAVQKNSPLGNLQGPDNIVIFKTKRYLDNPLVIQGPGAGLKVTAAGVFGDILSVTTL